MHRRTLPLIVVSLTAALMLTACAPLWAARPNEPEAARPTPPSEEGDVPMRPAIEPIDDAKVPDEEMEASPTPTTPPLLEPALAPETDEQALHDLVLDDLAGRLELSRDAIAVREIEAVDWPDSSVGCPAPDMAYLMVITPGYRVVLEAEGRQYTYHTESTRRAVLCEDGRPVP